MASARMSRPSASVSTISTVLPLALITMSPGRCAEPLIMFSVMATTAITSSGRRLAAITSMAASTGGPPPLSPLTGRPSGALTVARPRPGPPPRHVALHGPHLLGLLDREAARVEGDALADQRQPDIGTAASNQSSTVLHPDNPRSQVGARPHAEQQLEAARLELLRPQDVHLQAMALANLARDPGEGLGSQVVGRHVLPLADPVGGLTQLLGCDGVRVAAFAKTGEEQLFQLAYRLGGLTAAQLPGAHHRALDDRRQLFGGHGRGAQP